MKVIFTETRHRLLIASVGLAASTAIEVVGRGISLMIAKRGGRRGKTGKAPQIDVQVKANSRISESDAKALNDQSLMKLEVFQRFVEIVTPLTEKVDEIREYHEGLLAECRRAKSEVESIYRKAYGTLPVRKSPKKNVSYTDQELSRWYLQFVIETGNVSPTQMDLDVYSGISQSTWSRTFEEHKFWVVLNKSLENLWSAGEIVQDRIAHSRKRRKKGKEVELKLEITDSTLNEDGTTDRVDVGRNDVEEQMHNIVEVGLVKERWLAKLKKRSRAQLIQELIKRYPTTFERTYDQNSDGELRDLIIMHMMNDAE